MYILVDVLLIIGSICLIASCVGDIINNRKTRRILNEMHEQIKGDLNE